VKKKIKKNIEDILALTPLQEGMLFHFLKDSESEYYFEQLCLTITGRIDLDCFKQAWNFVIETNEMLRTHFKWEKVKKPVQVVLKEHQLPLRYYDLLTCRGSEGITRTNGKGLKGLAANDKKEWLQEIKVCDRKDKLDLRDVPFRVTLCRVEKNEYEMIVSGHHILYDGWSGVIILREFFQAYHEFLQGKTPIRPVKARFKEFVKWFQQQNTHAREHYWEKYLKEVNSSPLFSIKKRFQEDNSGTVSSLQVQISREELENFVQVQKITLASLLYSAWGILLQKYNYSKDVVFGTTVSCRSGALKRIENTVGLCINTIPLRIKTNSNEKTADFLERMYRDLQDREDFKGQKKAKSMGSGDLFAGSRINSRECAINFS
jgi:NRPS condensation-like uncharacterized protein